VSDNPFTVRNSPVSSSIKTEIDHQSPKTEISSSYLDNSSPASAVAGFAALTPAEEEGKCGVGVVLTKQEAEKESQDGLNDVNRNSEAVVITTPALTTTTDV